MAFHEPGCECPVCAALGIEHDHVLYDNPELGDQYHGQYDPAHPELIHYEGNGY
jgi:hypothetical protein